MDRTFVKEMLGSMTRFEMLTPELLSEAASEGLTYEELELSMSQLGLQIWDITNSHTIFIRINRPSLGMLHVSIGKTHFSNALVKND